MSLTFQENSPTKVGAQVLRHQLRVKTRSMKFCVLRQQLRTEACGIGSEFDF